MSTGALSSLVALCPTPLTVHSALTLPYSILLLFSALLSAFSNAKLIENSSLLLVPGMDIMTSDKHPHIGIIERVSRTRWYRHRRQVIAGPVYDWQSYEIPYTIWGGDCKDY